MTILAIVLGLIPLVLGGILNWISLNTSWWYLGFVFMSILMLAVWIMLAYYMRPRLKDTFNTVILLNLFAVIFIILFAVQCMSSNEFIPGTIGRWPQLFFLPLTFFGGILTGGSLFLSNVVGFLIMLLLSYFGCILSEKNQE